MTDQRKVEAAADTVETPPPADRPAPRPGLTQRVIAPLVSAIGGPLLVRLLRESVVSQRRLYGIAVVAMATVAGTAALSAWIMGEIVDSMTMPEARGRVFAVAGGVALIFFVKGLASFVQMVAMSHAGNRIVAEKQSELFAKLLRQGVGFFNVTESSDLIVRVTQSAQMARQAIDVVVTSAVRDLLTLVGLIAVMIYQQPTLTLVGLLIGPLAVLGVRQLLRKVAAIMAQNMAALTEIMRVLQETSTGVRIVKAYGLEPKMADRMNVAVRQVEKRANRIARLQAATTPLLDTLTGIAIAGIVALSVINLFGTEASTPGQLMSFVTALLMAYEPAKRLSRMRVAIEASMVGVRMMYDLLDRPEPMDDRPGAPALARGPGAVRLEEVRFGYDGTRPVLDGLSMDFPAGQTTALVGPSGGGKSTVLNLILRLYDPDAGRVTIDGADTREVSLASLRQRIAFVGQDTFLFAAPVGENIRMGRPDATDAEVEEAARMAHAAEFIEAMPQGYATPVGENGAFLSGGQRQRIAIARAVLRRAPILLLDEATSALDTGTEQGIQASLRRMGQGRTVITIAHRLSTIVSADRIVVLEAGDVVEQGTHAELLAANGRYAALWRRQAQGDADA
jgi:ATP-binding cassette subfamily B protein